MDTKNYYEILEVPTNATMDEIQRGHIRAKNAYSSDSLALYSLMSDEECARIINMIEEAFSILSDPLKRSQYDQARGIKTSHERGGLLKQAPINSIQSTPINTSHRPAPNRTSMAQIVAKKKFVLDYQRNETKENEIETTEVFSGEFLRSIREYKNVDINRMSDLTKVSKTYIKNIEEENIEKLPALVYVRGFVYQYAKCLKLNPEQVATSYLSRVKALKEEA